MSSRISGSSRPRISGSSAEESGSAPPRFALGLTGRLGAALCLALLGLGFVQQVSAPTASFSMAPSNPSAGQSVQFTDTSAGLPSAWSWSFGDGQTSIEPSPQHTYAAAGSYVVGLAVSNVAGQTATIAELVVSDEDTLRLIASHPFEATLTARDPRTGNTGTGRAIPQNDIFGFFTIPALVPTSGPLVPEVFLKILDATAIGQNYWVFWGGLTDLEYTLRVVEAATGAAKEFHNPATGSPACLGADTSGFESAPTATPAAISPTTTATRATTPGFDPTPTRTPTPTPTPTASGPEAVQLEARSYQWDFLEGPDISFTATWPGQNTITLRVGHTYRFDVLNGNPVGLGLSSHTFSGVASIGLSGGAMAPGAHLPPATITVTSAMVGTYMYSCTDSTCGSSSQHDQMGGHIVVAN